MSAGITLAGLFSIVVAHYYRELQALLARTLKDRHAAEDVVQESYARVLALQRSGRQVDKFRSVLYRTAYNLVIDRSRNAKLRNHESLDALDPDTIPAAPTTLEPDQQLSQAQRARALLQAIEDLPPRCRQAFVMYKVDDLPQREIAARMGISVNMVERHIMRGMDACHACLNQLDGVTHKEN